MTELSKEYLDLKLKIKKKREIIKKHSDDLEVLKSKCTHEEVEHKEKYYPSGYDYFSETYKWDQCLLCGKRLNETVKYGTTYG